MSEEKRQPEIGERAHAERDEFARQVRDALNRLYDVAYLQNHRLARLVPEPASRDTIGKTLQHALQDAIETLRSPDSPAAGRIGRSFDLLRLRFVEGLAVEEVCTRLGISTREYYREYPKGLDAVVSILWERWRLGTETDRLTEGEPRPLSLSAPRRPAGGLAQPLSSFIGRERELARMQEILRQGRLVTLLGPPGTGKTRLALAAAPFLAASFSDGVVFVPLATVREAQSVIPAIAHALGLEALAGASLEDRLIEALRDRSVLLILDNFEQVVAAGPSLVDLLAVSPGVRAVVTSRIRLNLRGERLLPVPPLAVPDAAFDIVRTDAEAVARFESVRLFCERAQEVESEFRIDAENAGVIAEICRSLDGLPLAIELAAARIDTVSPRALRDQLTSASGSARLDVLSFGASDLPARQQTLRDAIAWSYDLLDARDRAVFRRLSVFVGGFQLTSADNLLAPDVEGATLDRLESLLRRSLLTREMVDGEARFVILETLREFAAEQLAESGEVNQFAERHARQFLALGELAKDGMEGPDQRLWLERLERERPNLLAALAWFSRHAPVEGLRLAASLGRFWHIRGYFREGRRWTSALLKADEDRAQPRALALVSLAILEDLRGESRKYLEEALEIFRSRGDENGTAITLSWLAHSLQLSGESLQDRSRAEEALTIARRNADPRTLATVLDHIAAIDVRDGNLDRAREHFAESIDIWRTLGDPLATGRTVTSQGNLARLRGDFDFAHACFMEGLAAQRAMGYRAGAAWQLSLLGNLARARGDRKAASNFLREAVATADEFGGEHFRAVPILFTGQLLLQSAEQERGVTLIAAALTLDSDLKVRLDADERADLDTQLETARGILGTEGFARAWSVGAGLTVSAAIEIALSLE